ncbi:ATP-binding protein [Cellulomonas carbonis]|uniref:HTH cro/C1-type domain-containing protein n=1 Tax=Cellulomonas carbonis T26 TaxID=947969 RepID=A0A0A0BP57_9CELL|nr:helix-turn-helix domain-containing protein [Cellulomonas carbonis]KGM08884.1 hypothetical protein N868_13355 [Cellulomonas carbonis T26]GGC15720.1 hypothetical protein GCM10010972_31270 [Cellulomonas carbonis]
MDSESRDGEAFGTLLRRLREGAGLTQEELAERAGLTAHGVSALERGTRTRPYPHTVRSLAGALGLDEVGVRTLVAAVPRRPRRSDPADRPTEVTTRSEADPGGPTTGPAGAVHPASDHAATAHAASGPTATAVTPPASVRTPVPTPVPAPVTALVGRDDDVAAVTSLLRRTTARLVTLTGTGGVGKTTLALAVARAVGGDHADGVAVVPLAAVDDGALVVPAVARALGLSVLEAPDAEQRLLAELAGSRTLLVLDNLEHLPEVGMLVARLLEACPGVVVLATSRAALRVRGESEYAVQPLALPPSDALVEESPACALLLERARAVSPGFGSRADDGAAVAAICRRLAGIPLALELAAARARVLDAPSLLARLDESMARDGATDLPPRQRTMRATLDWGYRLLGHDERALYRRLSVCSGGCDLDAVEALGADLPDPVGLLERLVEHSLVVVHAGDGGGPRYRMLEPVLQHARSLLEEDDAERVAARTAHARHFLASAEDAAPRLEGADQVRWLERAVADDANLASAVEWWVESGDGARAGAMVWHLWLYWWLRGNLLRGRRLAEAALTLPMPRVERAKATLTMSAMAFAQGDLDASGYGWGVAWELAAGTDDVGAQVGAAGGCGLVALARGDLALAERWFRSAIDLTGDGPAGAWVAALSHIWLGTVRLLQGDPTGAVEQIRPGLESARRRGDRLTTYIGLYGLVQAALAEGRTDDARTYLVEGIGLSAQTRDLANLSHFLESLAVVEGATGDHLRAATLLGASLDLRERVGADVYGYYLPDPALRGRTEAESLAALGPSGLAIATDAGRALGPDGAIAYALAGEA